MGLEWNDQGRCTFVARGVEGGWDRICCYDGGAGVCNGGQGTMQPLKVSRARRFGRAAGAILFTAFGGCHRWRLGAIGDDHDDYFRRGNFGRTAFTGI